MQTISGEAKHCHNHGFQGECGPVVLGVVNTETVRLDYARSIVV